MELDQTQLKFREGMSRMGAAVNLLTSDGPAGKHGLVASAVCSVSDSPATLLVCINRNAFVHDKFLQNFHICVNVLAAQHQALSGGICPLCRRGSIAGRTGEWTTLVTGCPVLKDANVAFDCRIGSVIEQGSHSVMFCQVKDVHVSETAGQGLVYFSRDYHHLKTGALK